MHQRITDLIYNGTVKFGIFTGHVQFHLLAELLVKISDHTRELLNGIFNGNHSNLHNRFMEIRGYAFEIFDLLVKVIIGTCS